MMAFVRFIEQNRVNKIIRPKVRESYKLNDIGCYFIRVNRII